LRKGGVVAALPLLVGGFALFGAQVASAQTLEKTFTISCAQADVNGGAPFPVVVQVAVGLPGEIFVGDVVEPTVDLVLTMPVEVADAIVGNGYIQMEGDVTATATVVGGMITPLTSDSLPLPV